VPERLAQGTVCKIPRAQEVKPHKVRYYLEPGTEVQGQDGAGAVRLPRV